jgi:tether containing UBX domain for GLUT4
MSHVIVFNSYAKSVRIPTTPVKYLTDVRDEACKKFGVNKDQFTLKLVTNTPLPIDIPDSNGRYNNKSISLSQQIRLANLPQGARLELVQASRSPTVISVALQLPKSRLTQKFASNTSLWEILRQFESGQGANYNFTQRGVPEMSGTSGAGRLNYEQPVITVLPDHREYSDLVALQQTLAQLGFDSGSALLKLSFRNSNLPLEEAMTQISQYFKTEESALTGTAGAHAATSAQNTSKPALEEAAPEATTTVAGETIRSNEPDPEPMDVDPMPETETGSEPEVPAEGVTAENVGEMSPAAAITAATSTASSAPQETPVPASIPPPQSLDQSRNVQIFAASTSSTPQAARNAWNENDYLPTIEHAKAHQAQLQTKTRNQRLLSDKELEEQEKARQEKMEAAAAKGGFVRIRMPDSELIQRDLKKEDTADGLYEFVKPYLDRKNEPFELRYTGPRGGHVLIAKDNKRLIQDLHFVTNELVTFAWSETASAETRASRKTLAQEWQAKAQQLKVEEPTAAEKSQAPTTGQTVAEGKRKANMTSEEKESKLKNMLGGKFFKRK